MKKSFTFLVAIACMQLSFAQVVLDTITLDLSQSTDPSPIVYNPSGEWDKTFNDSVEYAYVSSQGMNFSHLPSGESWGGMSWDGFTPSISTDNSIVYDNFLDHQWGCMAQGGVAGVGTPFFVAFHSDYFNMTSGGCGLHTIFDTVVTPVSVYLCNVPYTYKCITEGHTIASAFTQGDSLTVIIKGMDENFEELPAELHYHLADYRSAESDAWTLNSTWEEVDLSSLGKVSGLNFYLVSSDQSWGYMNTASYFALDKLSYAKERADVATNVETATISMQAYPNPFTDYIRIQTKTDAVVNVYNQQGMLVLSQSIQAGEAEINTSHLPAGIYIVRCGEYNYKMVK